MRPWGPITADPAPCRALPHGSSWLLSRPFAGPRAFSVAALAGSLPCASRTQLYLGVQQAADWQGWLPPQLSFRVEASGKAGELNHSHYTALEVKNALVDWQRQHFGQRSDVDLEEPDRVFHLHLGQGRQGPMASLCVADSATSLHRRGYRAAMGLAPPSRSSSGLGQNRSIHGPLGCLSQASSMPAEQYKRTVAQAIKRTASRSRPTLEAPPLPWQPFKVCVSN